MKLKALILTALLATFTTASVAQPKTADTSTTTADLTSITGVWRCDVHDLPAVTLTITDEGGNLNGAALFYLHKMEEGQPETATPGAPEPLFHPIFDGSILTFEVSHRRAMPPNTLNDPPITYTLKLVGPDKAELIDLTEEHPNRPRYYFTRSKY